MNNLKTNAIICLIAGIFCINVFGQNNTKVPHNNHSAEVKFKLFGKEYIEQFKDATGADNVQINFFTTKYSNEIAKDITKYFNNYSTYKTDSEIRAYFDALLTKYLLIYFNDKVKIEKDILTEQAKKNVDNNSGIQYKGGIGGNPTPLGPGQPCLNMDFEEGTTNGWTCYTGANDAGNTVADISQMAQGACGNGRHTVLATGGNDPIVGAPIPLTSPAGSNFLLRLGNSNTGAQTEAISQTFLVDSFNTNFTYYYAVVFEDPNHTTNEQPFFEAHMYDVTGGNTEILCAKYVVKAGTGIPGFQNGPGSVKYKTWTPVFVPLANYIGKDVRIDFVTGDCSQGGHYGYAYIDAACQPLEIISSSPVVCGGSSVTLTAPAGAATYQWSSNAGSSTSQTVSINAAGTYTVTMTAVSGCSTSLNITLPGAPGVPVSKFTATSPCAGTATNFTDQSFIVGGTVTDWFWDFGVSGTNADTSIIQNPTYTYPAAGTYNVTLSVTTDGGCVKDTIIPVIVNSEPTVNISTANVTCYGQCNGNAIVTVTNATSPFTYNWSNGSNIQNPTTLCAGSHTVSVTDATGCKKDTTITITQPPPYSGLSSTSSNSNCGNPDGSASVTNVSGATPPYTYAWSTNPVQNTATANNLNDGTYYVSISDNNGCDTVLSVNVGLNPPPTANASGTPTTCNGACDGSAVANGVGGTTPGTYTYTWSTAPAQNNQTATGLCAGSYSVTVTDGNGCVAVTSVNIFQPSPVAVVTNVDTTICITGTAFIAASASGGTAPYSYSWDNGWQTPGPNTDNPSAPTCYSVTATDANNCVSPPKTVCVNLYPPVDVIALSNQTVCKGSQVSLSASATGGKTGATYSYTWNNGLPSQQFVTANPPGAYPDSVIYQVIASDGCSPTDTSFVTIKFHPDPIASFKADTIQSCLFPTHSFVFTNNSVNSASCVWTMGDGANSTVTGCSSFSFVYNQVGTYTVGLQVISPEGCKDDTVAYNYITVHPMPTADFSFSPQPTTVQDMDINFTDLSNGNIVVWDWDFYDNDMNTIIGNSFIQNPSYNFASSSDNPFIYHLSDTGLYPVQLLVQTNYGCLDSITKEVKIDAVFYLNIPNAFTPNGDGINDFFFPVGIGIDPSTNFNFYIFNRWGDLIFESHRLDDPWDGTARALGGTELVQGDVYVWKLEVQDVTPIRGRHVYSGHVTVVK